MVDVPISGSYVATSMICSFSNDATSIIFCASNVITSWMNSDSDAICTSYGSSSIPNGFSVSSIYITRDSTAKFWIALSNYLSSVWDTCSSFCSSGLSLLTSSADISWLKSKRLSGGEKISSCGSPKSGLKGAGLAQSPKSKLLPELLSTFGLGVSGFTIWGSYYYSNRSAWLLGESILTVGAKGLFFFGDSIYISWLSHGSAMISSSPATYSMLPSVFFALCMDISDCYLFTIFSLGRSALSSRFMSTLFNEGVFFNVLGLSQAPSLISGKSVKLSFPTSN